MAAPYTKKNTLPYDFITDGTTGVYDPDGGSLQDLASGGTEIVTALNTNNNSLNVTHAGITQSYLPAFQYFYDFEIDGGEIGVIALRGPKLPANFVILNAIWEPTIAFSSDGSAQISIGSSSAAETDLVGAAVLGTNGTTGRKQGVPDWAVGDSVKVTVESAPVIEVTVADLTAGVGTLVLFGYVGSADAQG
jgi:hypothetical protein